MTALRSTRRTWASGVSSLWLTLLWEGRASARNDLPWLASSTVWESHTPFIAPRHLKKGGRNALEGQLRAELEQRNLSGLLSVEVSAEIGGRVIWQPAADFWTLWHAPAAASRLDTRWRAFRRERRKPQPHIADQPALGLRLIFAGATRGPITLGYGSHLGLGLFAAARSPGEAGARTATSAEHAG